jgi:hypothetical protein
LAKSITVNQLTKKPITIREIIMKIKSILLVTLTLFVFSTTASAVVIDFQSLEHIDSLNRAHGFSYSEDGFTLVDASGRFGFHTFGTERFGYSGSTALFNGFIGGITILTQDNGDPFSIYSIDLAELIVSDGLPGASVLFEGVLSSGVPISQRFTLDGNAFDPETFLFADRWNDLTEVSWIQAAPSVGSNVLIPHQFDNIVLNSTDMPDIPAVPVPAAFWLFGTALIGFVGISRRRKVS